MAFAVADRALHRFTGLSAEAYQAPVIARGLFGKPLTLALVVVAVVAAWRMPRLRSGYDQLDFPWALRVVTGFAGFCLAWKYSTYSYNFYLDQAHAFDRSLLWLWFVAALWRPWFWFLFVVHVHSIIGQFEVPLGGHMWVIGRQLNRILLLFTLIWALRAVMPRRLLGEHDRGQMAEPFFLVLFCLIASGYWWPGLGKLELGWLGRNHIEYLVTGAYAQGWRADQPAEAVVVLMKWLEPLAWPIRVGTLVLEVGSLAILWRRRGTMAFLVGWIGFHASIFIIMGFLFWQWIVLEMILLGLLWRGRIPASLFTLKNAAVGSVLVAGTVLWFEPVTQLAWLDTRLYYAFEYEAHGQDGNVYSWRGAHFAPYSDRFTMGEFGNLRDRPELTGAYGVTRWPHIEKAVNELASAEGIAELEQELLPPRAKPTAGVQGDALFDGFVSRYLATFNARGGNRGWWNSLSPPSMLLSSPRPNDYRGQEPIRELRVHRVVSWFDGVSYVPVSRRELRRIAAAGQ